LDFLRGIYRRPVQIEVPFPDVPQCPVHRFLDEVAVIHGRLRYYRKQFRESLIAGLLIVPRQTSYQ
jgi:hypothetical protein